MLYIMVGVENNDGHTRHASALDLHAVVSKANLTRGLVQCVS